MKSKILVAVMTAMLALCFAGCGETSTGDGPKKDPSSPDPAPATAGEVIHDDVDFAANPWDE